MALEYFQVTLTLKRPLPYLVVGGSGLALFLAFSGLAGWRGLVMGDVGSRVYASGSVALPQTFMLDLDNGILRDDSEGDLWFQALTASKRYLKPVNGALLGLMRDGQGVRQSCRTAKLFPGRFDVASLSGGTRICFKTNQGRYGELMVIERASPHPGVVKLSYTTWDH
jgi:hypothetical protein